MFTPTRKDGASNTRLRPLMEQSRKEQNEVSTRLAEQVLEALWILLRGFAAAGLQAEDPSHIYGGLITMLLRQPTTPPARASKSSASATIRAAPS